MKQNDPDAEESKPEFPYWRRNFAIVPVAALLSTLGLTMTIPFVPLMLLDLGVTDGLERWSGNTMLLFYLLGFLLNPIWGGVADHFGRKAMVLRATLGMGGTMWIASFATTPVWFAALFLLVGVFNGTNAAYNSLLLATTPKRKVGTALTLAQSGVLMGRIIGPGLAALALTLISEHHLMLRFSGSVLLAGGILAMFARDVHQKAEVKWRLRWLADLRSIASVPRMPTLLILCFISNVMLAGSITITTLFMLELVAANPGSGDVTFWVGVTSMGLAVASLSALPLWARALNRGGAGTALAIALVAAILTHIPMLFLTTPLQLMITRIVFGFTAIGMQPAIVRLLSQYAPDGMQGRAISYGQSFTFLSSGIAPFVAGLIAPVFGLRAYFALVIASTLFGLFMWLRASWKT